MQGTTAGHSRFRRLTMERLEPRLVLTGVVINEFLASNTSDLADEDGDHPDWIELYNPDSQPVNLSGWYLTDSTNNLTKWQFPNVDLAADGYLVVFASNKDRAVVGQELHTNFALGIEGEYLALVMPDGVTVAHDYTPTFPSQVTDISYGLGQVVAEFPYVTPGAAAQTLVPTDGSYDAVWSSPAYTPDGNWISGTTGIGATEMVAGFTVRNFKAAPGIDVSSILVAEEIVGDPSSYTNVVTGSYDVVNFYGTGGDTGRYSNPVAFPGSQIGVDVDHFITVVDGIVTIPSAGDWTFGVRSDDGFRLQVGDYMSAFTTPRGPDDTLATFTFDAAGDYPIHLVFFERTGGAMLELFAAPGTHSSWNSTNFRLMGNVAGGGLAVNSAPVSSDGSSIYQLLGTDVQSQMIGVNSTFYTRIEFNLDDPTASLDQLLLRMKYNDAFVATLNGVEVARRNVSGSTTWNSVGDGPRSIDATLTYEEIDLTSFMSLLVPGQNLLAIQGINVSANDPNVLILPELVGIQILADGEAYFATPTPDEPNGPGHFGFVEKPQFNVEHGFFVEPFQVVISVDTPAAQIYYTTNGATPTPSSGTLYTGPIDISDTTVLRAAAFLGGYLPTNANTQTYLFLADVIQQSSTPPSGWPTGTVNGQILDYALDPNIVNHPVWGPQLIDALQAIPTYSIVTDLPNLFHPATGIYVNAYGRGREWERPTSIELIHPDDTLGFQIDAGLRIRGGFSRSGSNPKHAFRLYFRNDYEGPLEYALFGADGTDVLHRLDLRTSQNYSWSFSDGARMTMVRDIFSRDTMRDLGQPYSRGNFAFLYINGVFWGIFQTEERKDDNFGATYFGGDEDEYDVVKAEPGPYRLEVLDGNDEAFLQLWTLANQVPAASTQAQRYEVFMRMQGLNPDGTRNLDYPVLLDTDNLIDYMLVILYGGNLDAPISNFLGNTGINNWYGIRNRNGEMGFQFFVHDSEHTLLNVNENRNGPYPAGSAFDRANPQWIHQQLMYSDEYRMQFADRVQAVMFNDGPMTTEANLDRHQARTDEIALAILLESARWGDSKRQPAYTKNDWQATVNAVNSFIANRNAVLLNQLRNTRLSNNTLAPLFPSITAPSFSQFGGQVPEGYQLVMTAPAGTIWYTLDGSDPRTVGGTVSPSAKIYFGPITLDGATQVKARVSTTAGWSALIDATFVTSPPPLPGDYDGNGVVDEGDYLFWKESFGLAVVPGSGADGNGNGLVDAADYTIWRDRLMAATPAAFPFEFLGQSYTQDFNAFRGTAETLPAYFSLTVAGGSEIYRGVFDTTTSSASSFTGVMGATSDGTDYSLAWRESTGPAALDDTRVLFAFTNQTGEAISGFEVSYDVEAWINGRRDNQLRFKYDVYPDSAASQAAEGRQAFETDIFATPNPNHTPIATNGEQFVLDGKGTANRVTVGGYVDLAMLLVDETNPALGFFGALLPGQTAYFRWQISNGLLLEGNRSALGIDNLTITPLGGMEGTAVSSAALLEEVVIASAEVSTETAPLQGAQSAAPLLLAVLDRQSRAAADSEARTDRLNSPWRSFPFRPGGRGPIHESVRDLLLTANLSQGLRSESDSSNSSRSAATRQFDPADISKTAEHTLDELFSTLADNRDFGLTALLREFS